MKGILKGVAKFQAQVYPKKRALFERLSKGQTPKTLFITCADSRIDPCLLTQTDPGELFVLRNAGNLVPTHGAPAGGEMASIEYAILALKVQDVIVCGHSDCGAMKAVLAPQSTAGLPEVAAWLTHAQAARAATRAAFPDQEGPAVLSAMIRQNVVAQLRNLATHPSVASRQHSADFALHGWVYDIGSGSIEEYDVEQREFRPLGRDRARSETRKPKRRTREKK